MTDHETAASTNPAPEGGLREAVEARVAAFQRAADHPDASDPHDYYRVMAYQNAAAALRADLAAHPAHAASTDASGAGGTASRWCSVHDEPAAECWSEECLTGTGGALSDDEKKSLHPHAGNWAGFYAAVERIVAARESAAATRARAEALRKASLDLDVPTRATINGVRVVRLIDVTAWLRDEATRSES